jgi:hypothetical protein
VIYVLPAKGMGITFGAIPADGQLVLDDWIAESTG